MSWSSGACVVPPGGGYGIVITDAAVDVIEATRRPAPRCPADSDIDGSVDERPRTGDPGE